MKSLMRYKIISGRVVEKRDVLMEVNLDPASQRCRARGKRRGKSAAAQIERNLREAVKRLARVLNCNFQGGDLFLSLKYSDARLPADKEEAKREVRNFMRRIARAYRKATGKKLRWALVTADRSSKTGKPVRLHHHVVMDAVAWELVAAHWPSDQFSYRRLDGSGDYTAIARYMVQNAGYAGHEARETPAVPTRTWSTSQGLEKPIFTAPEPIREAGSFQVPKSARIVEREVRQDEESGFHAAYIRYVLPEAPNPRVGADGSERGPEPGPQTGGGGSGWSRREADPAARGPRRDREAPNPRAGAAGTSLCPTDRRRGNGMGSPAKPNEAGLPGRGGARERNGCPARSRAKCSGLCDDDFSDTAKRGRTGATLIDNQTGER